MKCRKMFLEGKTKVLQRILQMHSSTFDRVKSEFIGKVREMIRRNIFLAQTDSEVQICLKKSIFGAVSGG